MKNVSERENIEDIKKLCIFDDVERKKEQERERINIT
jgi:hypothetical protein